MGQQTGADQPHPAQPGEGAGAAEAIAAGTGSGAEAPGAGANRPVLGEREQQMLALEREWWKYSGAKEQAIRDLFNMSATHYYQVLNAVIDSEAALAHDPMLVKRLRRLRTSRQRARSARRLGADI